MSGHPTFNQEKLTKRAKRQVGFVLQVTPDPHHAWFLSGYCSPSRAPSHYARSG